MGNGAGCDRVIAASLIGPESSFISSFFLAQPLADVWLLPFAQPPDALNLATRKPANPYPGAVSAATRHPPPCFRLSSYSSHFMYSFVALALVKRSRLKFVLFARFSLFLFYILLFFYQPNTPFSAIFQTFSRTRRTDSSYYTSSGSLFIPEGHAVLYLHTSRGTCKIAPSLCLYLTLSHDETTNALSVLCTPLMPAGGLLCSRSISYR